MRTAGNKDILYISIIVLLSILIHSVWFLVIALNNKDYLFDITKQENPDAVHYYILGKNIIENSIFSREEHQPFRLSPIRTPGYPFLLACIIFISQRYSIVLIILVQIILYILGSVLLYLIVKDISSERIAFIAAMLMVFDLTSHTMAYQVMAETVYTTLLLLVVYLAISYMRNSSFPKVVCLAILTSAIAYVKPAGFYLSLMIPVFLLLTKIKSIRNLILSVLMFAMIIMAFLPWIYRNRSLFGINRLSMIDTINLVYFTGASVLEESTGKGHYDVQRMISERYSIPPYRDFMNLKLANKEYARYDKRLRSIAREIILKHPGSFIISTVKSFFKGMLSHSAGSQAYLLKMKYTPPGLNNILKMRFVKFFSLLGQNHVPIIILFITEVIFNLFITAFFIIGFIYIIFRQMKRLDPAKRKIIIFTSIIILYMILISCSLGVTTYYRFRVPNMPLIFIIVSLIISEVFVGDYSGGSGE